MLSELVCPYVRRLTIPYKDIYTTVYWIETEEGVLLFDSASYPEDIKDVVLPALAEAGVTEENLKAVFISHNHNDHAGGLKTLLEAFPQITVYSRHEGMKEKYPNAKVYAPENGEKLFGVLSVVAIPGHTLDSAAVLDHRTGTLITGDCLQVYGIFGSGNWGSNIRYPALHIEAVQNIPWEQVQRIYAAHDYSPIGFFAEGNEAARQYGALCVESLMKIRDAILASPEKSDEEITLHYNATYGRPTLGVHVITAVRAQLIDQK